MVIKETSRSHHLACFEEFQAVEELNDIKYSQAAGMTSSSTSDLRSHYNHPDTTTRSKAKVVVKKHVHFSNRDNEIIHYQVTKDKDDIKNSWLNIDVSNTLEMARNENQDKIVSFGPIIATPSSSDVVIDDLCKNGKEYVYSAHTTA